VPASLLTDGRWFHDYLQRRLRCGAPGKRPDRCVRADCRCGSPAGRMDRQNAIATDDAIAE
jgi:hypothetical protein